MQFNELDLGRKLIIISFCLACLSLLLPWVELGIVNASGFQQQAYLFLIPFLYPLIYSIRNEDFSNILSVLLSLLAIISIIAFMHSKSDLVFFDKRINASGSGAYIFLISSFILLIGCIIKKQLNTNTSLVSPLANNFILPKIQLLENSALTKNIPAIKEKVLSSVIREDILMLIDKHKKDDESISNTLERVLKEYEESEKIKESYNVLQKEHLKVRAYAVKLQKELKTLKT